MILNYSNCVTPISSPFCFNGTVDSEADEDQSSLSEALYGFCRGRCRWFLLRWCPYAGSRRWRGRGENVKLSYCSINGFQVDFGCLPLLWSLKSSDNVWKNISLNFSNFGHHQYNLSYISECQHYIPKCRYLSECGVRSDCSFKQEMKCWGLYK